HRHLPSFPTRRSSDLSAIEQHFPGVLRIAEESTAFTGVSHPLEQGGLGFTMKWNMGWMNDTLRYFHKDPLFRNYNQSEECHSSTDRKSTRLNSSHDQI